MIDLPTIAPFAKSYERPANLDWSTVRTFWVCVDLSDIDKNPSEPVAVRRLAEDSICRAFEKTMREIASCGEVEAIWLGESIRDGVDWMDERRYYPVRVIFDKPPRQLPRPCRISPLCPDRPEDAIELFQEGIQAMFEGDYEKGLPLYEYRFQTAHGAELWRPMEMPYWDGVVRPDQRILILCEQGAGDVIQFSRYLPMLNGIADLWCFSELCEIVRSVGFTGRIDESIDCSRIYDAWLPICSLPLALHADPKAIWGPYMRADEHKSKAWRERLPKGHKTGIVWGGSPIHKLNSRRCFRLDQILAHVPAHSQVYSLQKGSYREQLKYAPFEITDLADELHTYGDTAAVIENLDLVVTIDTSVAHLAGALGKPVKIIVGPLAEWRWGQAGEKTHWYSSAELIRSV